MLTATSGKYRAKAFKHTDEDTATCPHCWTVFPYEDVLYVSRHPDLIGDPMLGDDAPSRFKPSRFTPEGQAIDPGGYPCLEMACPNCHLAVPRVLAEFKPMFLSIVGTQQAGKSYFLATAMWDLRKRLAEEYGLSIADVETELNQVLHRYEEILFFPKNPTDYVLIEKTEEQGQLYDRVMFDGTETMFPKPFVFSLTPQPQHPSYKQKETFSRSLILYDNAGEHFDPSHDSATKPGTMHLSKSECVIFVFDPTQDPRFRERLVGNPDPQTGADWHIRRQDVVLNEAARRIRRHTGTPHNVKLPKTLIVVVNKSDIWGSMLKLPINPNPSAGDTKTPMRGLDIGHIEDVSLSVQYLLNELCPEFVQAAEDFAERIVYIPISCLGHAPRKNEHGGLDIRPMDLKPFWVSVPFLYAFMRMGMVYRGAYPPPPGTPAARILSRHGGKLQCQLPDGMRLELPERFAGRLLHDPATGSAFVVPKV